VVPNVLCSAKHKYPCLVRAGVLEGEVLVRGVASLVELGEQEGTRRDTRALQHRTWTNLIHLVNYTVFPYIQINRVQLILFFYTLYLYVLQSLVF